MKTLLLVLFLTFSSVSFAQLRKGFDPNEAKSLIALCNSFTFLELYGSDTLIIPKNYKKVYTSDVIGLDNMFQVYESGKVGVINFRGSTTKISSWLENIYSAMIPAEGIIKINNVNYSYKFAKGSDASVHSGYALAVVLLSSSIISQINKLNSKEIYNIMITGHSQGGALAQMVRAYIENLPDGEISSRNTFKTYAFANPMCGNKEFSDEYNIQFTETGLSYSIINPEDLIPKMPMHIKKEENEFGNLFHKSLADFINQGEIPNLKNMALQVFEPALQKYVFSSNQLIEKLISATYVSIDLPEYVTDINYFKTGGTIELEPFPNPKVPVDTVNMAENEIAKLNKDENGNYYNSTPSFFQHKPYNYYVAIYKKYFTIEYSALDLKYLPENL